MKTTTEKIPTYALPYLINGDAEGLNDVEISMIDEWLEKSGITDVVCPTDETYQPYFTGYPAFGLPSEIVDCKCILSFD